MKITTTALILIMPFFVTISAAQSGPDEAAIRSILVRPALGSRNRHEKRHNQNQRSCRDFHSALLSAIDEKCARSHDAYK